MCLFGFGLDHLGLQEREKNAQMMYALSDQSNHIVPQGLLSPLMVEASGGGVDEVSSLWSCLCPLFPVRFLLLVLQT